MLVSGKDTLTTVAMSHNKELIDTVSVKGSTELVNED